LIRWATNLCCEGSEAEHTFVIRISLSSGQVLLNTPCAHRKTDYILIILYEVTSYVIKLIYFTNLIASSNLSVQQYAIHRFFFGLPSLCSHPPL